MNKLGLVVLRILFVFLVCACVNIYANESLEIKEIFNDVSKYIQPIKKFDILDTSVNWLVFQLTLVSTS